MTYTSYAVPGNKHHVEIIIRESGSSGNQTILRDMKTNQQLIFDAGIMPTAAMTRGFKSGKTSVVGICVTHCHRDHSGKLSYYDVPIYGTKEELSNDRVMGQYDFVHKSPTFKYVEPGKTYEMGSFKVTPIRANHDTENPVHYFVRIRDFTFFYGCDSVDYPYEYDKYFEVANVIMIECNYVRYFMDNDKYLSEPYPETLKKRIQDDGHASAEYIKRRFSRYENKLILAHLSKAYNNKDFLKKHFRVIAIAHNDDCPMYIKA